jgi:hypothetical protein
LGASDAPDGLFAQEMHEKDQTPGKVGEETRKEERIWAERR